jgi:pyruvate,water dikinase
MRLLRSIKVGVIVQPYPAASSRRAAVAMRTPARWIRWFADLGAADVPVGGKNASLGEMHSQMNNAGVRVPNGFAVTAQAYRHVIDQADAWAPLHRALDGLDAHDVDDLARRAQAARELVLGAKLPADLEDEILAAYAALRGEYGADLTVAVRSSATAEDLPTASFAGQHPWTSTTPSPPSSRSWPSRAETGRR